MAWTTAAAVRERAPRQFTTDNNWEDADVNARITRATNVLRAALVRIYGTGVVLGFDTTTPPLVGDLATSQAAVYCLIDAYGENQLDDDSPGGRLQAQVDAILKGLADGSLVLLDASGGQVFPDTTFDERQATFDSTTRLREPTFSAGSAIQPNQADVPDDQRGPGSLNDY